MKLLPFLFCVAASAQQLILTGPSNAVTGSTVPLTIALSGAAGHSVAALQGFIANPGGTATCSTGAAAIAASKQVSCNVTADGLIFVAAGINSNVLSDGAVVHIALTLNAPGTLTEALSNTLGADLQGNPISITTGGPLTLTVTPPPVWPITTIRPTLAPLPCKGDPAAPKLIAYLPTVINQGTVYVPFCVTLSGLKLTGITAANGPSLTLDAGQPQPRLVQEDVFLDDLSPTREGNAEKSYITKYTPVYGWPTVITLKVGSASSFWIDYPNAGDPQPAALFWLVLPAQWTTGDKFTLKYWTFDPPK